MPRAGIPLRAHALSTVFGVLCALCLCGTARSFADERPRARFDHGISAAPSNGAAPLRPAAVGDTLRVLAVMVEFQPDNDARTSGNGTFDLTEPLRMVKDPPPHDLHYFNIHLTFLSNYYRKVSDGKLEVAATLLPDVYRLPSPMREYSPGRASANNAELGRLVDETWRFVDSASPGTPFADYDAYIIFHAGVGRDIDLVSIYGYDPTPFDIPSIYMNLPSLRAIYGGEYEGVPVSGGSHFVRNSMIIPETESRTIPVINGSVLLELGINGLLAANVGSHLGLPDLFDTKTGRSGIGRFGLMDGQSIFSWNGFIPPEPSAWEKQFLGWVEPLTAPAGTSVAGLPAVGIHGAADTVFRVPLSAGEYYLVENRNRDAAGDGQTVTMVWGGDTLTRTWTRDTAGFTFVDQDSIVGTILDVDDFDWSLPGGVNSRTGEWYDGGVLIWHVDESVIAANLESGTVNADPERRGVDLEEADGSQDIGQTYGFISAGSGSEDGTVLDFWYAGNQAPLRVTSNLFGPASNPPSLGNNRTNSHVTISEFSARGPAMTARITLGDSVVAPLAGFPRATPASFDAGGVTAAGGGALIAVAAGSPARAYGWMSDGSPLMGLTDTTGLLPLPAVATSLDSLFPRAAVARLGGGSTADLVLAGSTGAEGRLVAVRLADIDNDLVADTIFSAALQRRPTTAPLVADTSVPAASGTVRGFIAVGTEGGYVYRFTHAGVPIDTTSPNADDSTDIVSLALLGRDGGLVTGSAGGRVGAVASPACDGFDPGAGTPPAFQGPVRVAAGRFRATSSGDPNLFTFIAASEDGRVAIGDICAGLLPGFPYDAGGPVRGVPAIADLDDDGMLDVILFAGRRVLVLNQAGAPLDGFPVEVPTSTDLAGSPVVADLDGDGLHEIAGVTAEGILFAYTPRGTVPDGFPLQAGPAAAGTPSMFYYQSGCLSCAEIGLAAASADGHLYAWKTGTLVTGPGAPPVQPWPQFARDAGNTASEDTVLAVSSPGGGFLPAARTYNWPNPVGKDDGYLTHIRYYVPSDARVTVRIFDMAGNLVRSFEGLDARGGLDNEVDWDVSAVESGVYFAQIEAEGQGGSGNAVVTIAVVK